MQRLIDEQNSTIALLTAELEWWRSSTSSCTAECSLSDAFSPPEVEHIRKLLAEHPQLTTDVRNAKDQFNRLHSNLKELAASLAPSIAASVDKKMSCEVPALVKSCEAA